MRRFDPYEYRIETGHRHQYHQFSIVRQIDGNLRMEDNIIFVFPPFDDFRQKDGFYKLFVADQVVISKIDRPSPPHYIKLAQFSNDLSRAFMAIPSPEQARDAAKFTIKRASSRNLHIHERVLIQVQELE